MNPKALGLAALLLALVAAGAIAGMLGLVPLLPRTDFAGGAPPSPRDAASSTQEAASIPAPPSAATTPPDVPSRQPGASIPTTTSTVAKVATAPTERRPVAATPAAAPPSPPAKPLDLGGLGAALTPAPPSADTGPSFDVARVEGTGDAVIAGRAAPGATVELLVDGKPYDRAVAGPSGHFVIVPRRLPAGDYDLALRTKRADGAEQTSTRTVAVSVMSRVREPPTAAAMVPRAAGAGEPTPPSPPPGKPAMAAADPGKDAPGAAKEAGPPVAGPPPISMRLVTRGDSLWEISRKTYGDGTHYPAILKANRGKIRNPDLIFPGQRFVLPDKTR